MFSHPYLVIGLLAAAVCVDCSAVEKARPPEGSPVAEQGRLNVRGSQLLNERGEPVQLRGMSSFWLNRKGEFANKDSIRWLQQDWGITVFRAAVGVEATNGLLSEPRETFAKVEEIVSACADLGLYVIIDYHTHYATRHPEEAKRFFDRMSKAYGHLPNVIYEPWNEPTKVSWTEEIRPYMEEVTRVIRSNDPDNIILAGNGWWSQKVDEAADFPLQGTNIMYSLHFYAGSHGKELRDAAEYAIRKGVALFVSEFGLSHADGGRNADRNVYIEEGTRWMRWMDSHKISWVNWSLSDKDESSAALKPGAPPSGGWAQKDLTTSGRFVREECLGQGVRK